MTDTYAGNLMESTGNDPVLNRIAWYDKNSGNRTHPVGRKVPNAWNLHDMLGNVWEWVGDRHGYYPGGTVTDPTGPRSGSGGLLAAAAGAASPGSAGRRFASSSRPATRFGYLGFRLLRK